MKAVFNTMVLTLLCLPIYGGDAEDAKAQCERIARQWSEDGVASRDPYPGALELVDGTGEHTEHLLFTNFRRAMDAYDHAKIVLWSAKDPNNPEPFSRAIQIERSRIRAGERLWVAFLALQAMEPLKPALSAKGRDDYNRVMSEVIRTAAVRTPCDDNACLAMLRYYASYIASDFRVHESLARWYDGASGASRALGDERRALRFAKKLEYHKAKASALRNCENKAASQLEPAPIAPVWNRAGELYTLAIDDSGRYLAGRTSQESIEIREVATGGLVAVIKLPVAGRLKWFSFAQNSTELLTIDTQALRRWPAPYKESVSVSPPASAVAVFSTDGRSWLGFDPEGHPCSWSGAGPTWCSATTVPGAERKIRQWGKLVVAFPTDSETAAVLFLDSTNGALIQKVVAPGGTRVRSVAVSPDSRVAAIIVSDYVSYSRGESLLFVEVESGRVLRRIESYGQWDLMTSAPQFIAPDVLSTCDRAGTIRAWDAYNGLLLFQTSLGLPVDSWTFGKKYLITAGGKNLRAHALALLQDGGY